MAGGASSLKKQKLSTVKARLWKVVSRYIRTKAADANGYASCVTCGVIKHFTELQAGHFIPKKRGNSIYFVEENIHPQCVRCNNYESGNLIEYSRYMKDMYGEEKIDELLALSRTTVKFTVNDLLAMEDEFKEKQKNLDHMSGQKWLDTGEI